jgi:hypothetical protein
MKHLHEKFTREICMRNLHEKLIFLIYMTRVFNLKNTPQVHFLKKSKAKKARDDRDACTQVADEHSKPKRPEFHRGDVQMHAMQSSGGLWLNMQNMF